ncbi:hypothetical protein VTP01DRAFT_10909 [Rhizomucor pusillus]|uniref:uncharacterized protein n=1 Tax=Rhizomucor pusillus TaxID=4840 RepID=UPI003741F266
MAFLSGFVKSGLSLLGKDSASFPYSIGDKVEWYDGQSIWSLHHGTKKDDGSKVSIFAFDCTKSRDNIQLARNAFKRMRTIRHPDLLRYLDGVESEQAIMFVTDPVEPLSNQLNQDPDPNLILWGLYKVANAIKFINNDCGMVHGNVRVSSIFVNPAGEWKLGSFDLLSSMQEESPIILTFGGLVPDAQRYAAPEVKKSGWTVIKDLPTAATDSFHLGCLIYEAYNRRFDTIDQLSASKGDIPNNMVDVYRALIRPSPSNRADAGSFLDQGLRANGFFTADFVQVNLFLENISIKEQGQKEIFFKKLDGCIDSFPSEFSKYKILPELIKAFEFGSGGAKALGAILKIAQHLPEDELQPIVVAPIIRMFSSPDRAIRISLLENMPRFIDHIPNKAVSNQIFPNVATGFNDTVPLIREQTIKSIMYLVPKLSDKIINYELLKYLAKLQMDEEPGIRTNTTICLGKIAKNLNDATRRKVLIPAFTRGLRDGFFHARVAALMALSATADFYDPQECALRVIPSISQVLLDKEKPVRVQAFRAMQLFINRVQEHADTMPETALEPATATSTAASPSSEQAETQASAMSMAGVFGGATKGLAGWAVSSINARFGTPSGEIANPTESRASPVSISETFEKAPASVTPSDKFKLSPEQSIAADEGWDNNGDDNLIGFEENDGWEPFDTPQAVEPEPITSIVPTASRASSFVSIHATSKAPGSMKLGQSKPKSLAATLEDEENKMPTKASGVMSKEEKRAEMERRREERRQRMAELREKKKSGIGAKKI